MSWREQIKIDSRNRVVSVIKSRFIPKQTKIESYPLSDFVLVRHYMPDTTGGSDGGMNPMFCIYCERKEVLERASTPTINYCLTCMSTDIAGSDKDAVDRITKSLLRDISSALGIEAIDLAVK